MKKYWQLLVPFFGGGKKLKILRLWEEAYHVVYPTQISTSCYIRSSLYFFLWWSSSWEGSEEVLRSPFYCRRNRYEDALKNRNTRILRMFWDHYKWPRTLLLHAFPVTLMPYLRGQDWWALGLHTVYSVALSFRSVWTVALDCGGERRISFSSLMVLTWSWRAPWIWNSRVNSEVKKWKRKKILCKDRSAMHTQADILPAHPDLSSKILRLSSSIFRCPTHALVSRNTILLSNVARRSAVLLSVQYCSGSVSCC